MLSQVLALLLVAVATPLAIMREKRKFSFFNRPHTHTQSNFCLFLAAFVNTCYMKDPNVDFVNCSTHAVQKLFDEFPNGIPAIDLSPLDPLILPRVKVSFVFGF